MTQSQLAEGLGVAPNTVARWERGEIRPQYPDRIIRALNHLDGARSTRAQSAYARRQDPPKQSNLPVEISSFVGRERETAELERLLDEARLLTLIGSGGVGKTRLARYVARRVVDRFRDGVRLVDLASLAEPDLVLQTVASALGVREEAHHPLDATLGAFLRERQMLIVLDNCEHLLGAARALANMVLGESDELRMLVTSRQPLGIPGEVAWRVPSLGIVPRSARKTSDEQLLATDAVQLFVQRARAVASNFQARPQTIAELCWRLDGIPLAIELAAARAGVLTPDDLLARLHDRFRLLGNDNSATLPRYQTLRGALDWSHDLLDKRERVLFRRLAIFVGGWTLDHCEAMCVGDASDVEPGLDSTEILDRLASLVNKSLVVSEPVAGGTSVRYSLLESVRAYAADKLVAAQEDHWLQRRHRDWFLNWAASVGPHLQGVDQMAWIARVDAEHDNVRAALMRLLDEPGSVEPGLHAAVGIERFWSVRGYQTEGRRWLKLLLHRADNPRSPGQVEAFRNAAVLAVNQGDYIDARSLVDNSVTFARELGDPALVAKALAFQALVVANQDVGQAATLADESIHLARIARERPALARALHTRALVARLQGDFVAFGPLAAEAESVARELGDNWYLSQILSNRALAARDQGNYAEAHRIFEHILERRRQLDDRWGMASSLGNLADINWLQGDLSAAQRFGEESLALHQELGDRSGTAAALVVLGSIARARGLTTSARALWEQSLTLRREFGQPIFVPALLDDLAELAADEGMVRRAFRLAGAAAGLRESMAMAPGKTQSTWLAATRLIGRVAELDAAWREGQAMDMVAAVSYALSADSSDKQAHNKGANAPKASKAQLTRREAQIALLLTRGMTNRQMAEALVITEKTASNHVDNILSKLGFHSRAQVAAWAVQQHLPTTTV